MEAKDILDAYRAELTKETLRRQKVDIGRFEQFLSTEGISVNNMFDNLPVWSSVNAEKLKSYREWLLKKGYALGSIEVCLATVRVYCRLAAQANVLGEDEVKRIEAMRGFGEKEFKSIDRQREHTRIGLKKEKAISISPEQASVLKTQSSDRLQDKRDALLMCLLLDQGLRISELSNLRVKDIDRQHGKIIHAKGKKAEFLTEDTLNALNVYLQSVSSEEMLLCSFHRNDKKVREGMTGRAINARVRALGEKVGLIGLAPEDCRRYWEKNRRSYGRDN